MERPAPDVLPTEDILPTSIEGIVGALARRGCADLTSSIDLTTCSDHPLTGGGYCEVYKGTLHDGSKIAIKSLKVYGSQIERDIEGQKVLKRAAKELYHWSKLKHPNVLSLMGLAVFKGFISMISGWMDNGDLPAYLKQNPDADRIGLCVGVCTGLCYIHKQGMVHGDLKGANIMISPDGIAMIADFGNARLQDLTLKFSNTTSRGLSCRWAAPELLLEDDVPQVSMEADVYAYGMVVLETLTGKMPYEGVGEMRVVSLVAYEKKVPPRPEVGMADALWELLNSCWAWEPSARPNIMSVGKHLGSLFPPPVGGLSDALWGLLDLRWAGEPSERPAITSDGDCFEALFSPPDAPLDVDGDIIGGAMSIEEIVGALARHGCSDLRRLVDLPPVIDYPLAGGWFWDAYQGVLHNGTRIAIKPMRPNWRSPLGADSQGWGVHKSTARKLSSWSKLENRNVLPLMGLTVFNGHIAMVTEWMNLGNLSSYLRQNPDVDRIRLCMDVCAGLSYMHTNGMAHGNLKGSNILISNDGTAMLADFGDARLKPLSARWAAPELLEGHISGGSMEADVYAYGMIVLEVLTDKVPYEGFSERRVIWLVVSEKQVPPRPDIGISDALWELLNWCWDWEPSTRPEITSVGDRLKSLFLLPDVPFNVIEGSIRGAMSFEDIVGAFARGGCPDLTSSIDMTTCNEFQYTERRPSTVHRGALYEGTKIAIKLLTPHGGLPLSECAPMWKELKQAARDIFYWSKLKHRNVLSLIGLAVFNGHISMITEWMNLGNLTSYLRQNPEADRIRLCMDVCAGLSYIHTNGMVHGNLKGTNILISNDGTAMIADFGHVRLKQLSLMPTDNPNSARSFRWVPPEVLLGDDSPRLSMEADVYAYGMTVLETLTGEVPYEGISERQVVTLVVLERTPPPRPNMISDGLWELLNLCWARVPSRRPKITSVGERLNALFPSVSPKRTHEEPSC